MVGRSWFVVVAAMLSVGHAARGDDVAAARAHFDEGQKQFNLGHFPEAQREFEQAYLAKPAPVFLFNLGQCHREMKSWGEAIHAWQRYLAAAPEAANRAAVEALIREAEAELARSESGASPAEQAKAKYAAGMTDYALHHFDDAIRSWEAGFRLAPKPQFLFNIAQAHRKAGRAKLAIDYYRSYLDLAPDASDRADVERAIAETQAEADKAASPAAATRPALPEATTAPATVHEGSPAPPAPPPAPEHASALPPASPPPATRPPRPEPIVAPMVPPVAEAPSGSTKRGRKVWPWAVGGAAVVVVGGAVALGLAFGLPDNAAVPTSDLGPMTLAFH